MVSSLVYFAGFDYDSSPTWSVSWWLLSSAGLESVGGFSARFLQHWQSVGISIVG